MTERRRGYPPPAPVGGKTTSKWARIAAELREHAKVSDEWEEFGPYACNSAGAMMRMFRDRHGLEATSRSNGDGTAMIWLRWNGETEVVAPEPVETLVLDTVQEADRVWVGVSEHYGYYLHQGETFTITADPTEAGGTRVRVVRREGDLHFR